MPVEVAVGLVGKPVGLHGEVYVHPDADLDHAFAPGTTYTTDRAGELTVRATRLHGGRRVVRFAEAGTREAAEALRGTTLRLPRDEVGLDDDSFWSDELLGADVRDTDGALLGVVEGVLDGPAHDYLVVARPDGGEVLVPAVAELVEVVAEGVVVRAIPGLLDPPPA